MADPLSAPPDELRADAQPQLRLAFDIALWRQQEQVDRARALDGKLGQTLGLNAAMIAVFGSAVLLASSADLAEIGNTVQAAAGLFIANIVVSTLAFVVGRWTVAPNLEELVEYAEVADQETLLRWALKALVRAAKRNERILRVKDALVVSAIGLTAATAVTLAVAAIRVAL